MFLESKEGTSTSMTVGGFVQDSWSIMDKVTVNVGVRYDNQTIWGLDGKVGLNLPNQWSPRVGVIYDFTQQGRSKLFANYARFYENVPLDMADLSFPQQQLLSSTYNAPSCDPRNAADLAPGGDCNTNANRQVIGNTESPNQFWSAEGGDRVPVDPNIRAQSSDEFVLGGEYEVLLGRVGLAYTKRYLNDVIEDMSRDDGTTFFLGNPGKGFSTDFPLAAPRLRRGERSTTPRPSRTAGWRRSATRGPRCRATTRASSARTPGSSPPTSRATSTCCRSPSTATARCRVTARTPSRSSPPRSSGWPRT